MAVRDDVYVLSSFTINSNSGQIGFVVVFIGGELFRM